MSTLEPVVRESAAWIWSKKNGPNWWTPLVLSEENTDTSNPHLSRGRAFQVFTVLEERRLILPITVKDQNGRSFPAYKINFNKESEWNKLIQKHSFLSLYFLPAVIWIWRRFWLLIVEAIALMLTSFGQAFFSKAGEANYERIFPSPGNEKANNAIHRTPARVTLYAWASCSPCMDRSTGSHR